MRPKEREGQSKRPLKQAWAQASFPPQLSLNYGASPAEWSSWGQSLCLGTLVLSCGQQGPPAATSARPLDASIPGGPGCRACRAAKAGHRKPSSDVLEPLARYTGRCCTTACKLSRGPCALLAVARLCFMCPVYVTREGISKTSCSVRVLQLCRAEADRPGRGHPASVRICLPAAAQDRPGGTSLLCWDSYLMYHQPSKFFRITSTVTPFSKPISSLLWLA